MVAGVSAPAFAGSAGINNTYTTSWSVYSTRTTGGSSDWYHGTSDSLTTSYKEGYDVGPNGPQIVTLHDTTTNSGVFGANFNASQVGNAALNGTSSNPASQSSGYSQPINGCNDEGEGESCEVSNVGILNGQSTDGDSLNVGDANAIYKVNNPASVSQISGSISGINLSGSANGAYANVHDVAHDMLLNVYHIVDTSSNHEVVFFGGSDFSNFTTMTNGGSNSSSHSSSAFANF